MNFIIKFTGVLTGDNLQKSMNLTFALANNFQQNSPRILSKLTDIVGSETPSLIFTVFNHGNEQFVL